ncbi:hypothetical protein HELRODRAFT_107657 [Helobdella robusta]|uniref:Copper transport protein n=1 Tax=Helobdella robusta TaxID=6412 RepID=T1EEC0_HELRO|nr:hypothetical protein HELRODRAFT_107657 [Helobdella robusta]ESN96713.1 hypothetical protein HELRODRAFT_107657 [Helobdella robusta]
MDLMSLFLDESGSHESNHSHHQDHSMPMYFHASCEATILFSFWKVSSITGMVVSCLIILVAGMLYEGLKVFREYLLMRNTECKSKEPAGIVPDCYKKQKVEPLPHLCQTALHGLQVFYSYCLMLIFMTYNVWLCVSLLLGAICGYFLFAWKRHKCSSCLPNSCYTTNDHCN